MLERNTGTVVAVRRNEATKTFLRDVLRIHGQLVRKGALSQSIKWDTEVTQKKKLLRETRRH